MMKKKMEEREVVRSWHNIHYNIDFYIRITLSNSC